MGGDRWRLRCDYSKDTGVNENAHRSPGGGRNRGRRDGSGYQEKPPSRGYESAQSSSEDEGTGSSRGYAGDRSASGYESDQKASEAESAQSSSEAESDRDNYTHAYRNHETPRRSLHQMLITRPPTTRGQESKSHSHNSDNDSD